MFKEDLLKGKRILVTGGGSGLGKEMSRYFLKYGAEVLICGRRVGVLEDTAKELMDEKIEISKNQEEKNLAIKHMLKSLEEADLNSSEEILELELVENSPSYYGKPWWCYKCQWQFSEEDFAKMDSSEEE